MTTTIHNTHWPLNISLESPDLRPGEEALTDTDLFSAKGLTLLCGVSPADLQSAGPGSSPWQRQGPGSRFDYLVCRNSDVLLAIHLVDRDTWYDNLCHLPDLAVAETTCGRFAKGDVSDILDQLEQILRKNRPPAWRCPLESCSPELTEALMDRVLLEQDIEGGVAPTEYGEASGLVRVRCSGVCRTMYSARLAPRLPELLSPRPPAPAAGDRLPFDKLMRLCRTGLARDENTSAALVAAVDGMPLEKYMDGFPEELEELQSGLPGGCDTYGEAARAIWAMLYTANDQAYTQGIILMRDLAAPPLGDRTVANAVRMGVRVTGRPPDYMPGRYRTSLRPGAIRSFADCVGRRQELPAGIRLAQTPQEAFFQGVGALARLEYPGWLSRTLRDRLGLTPRSTYGELVALANNKLEEDDTWTWGLGIRLLCLLLIEPYCLITNTTFTERRLHRHEQ